MSNFFNSENRVFSAINKFIDCVLVSIGALILCLPLFTIGAVISALYYTVHKHFMHGRGYAWSTFWGAFKSNFKNSTKTWLLQLFLSILFCMDIFICYHLLEAGSQWGKMIFIFVIMLVLILIWAIYCMCYFARFEQEPRTVRKNAGAMAVINFHWSILIGVVLVASGLCVYIVPITVVIMPVGAVTLYYLMLEKVFHKYMAPEDIAKEKEDNMIDEME